MERHSRLAASPALLACLLLAFAVPGIPQNWESALLPTRAGHYHRTPVDFDGRVWQLDDYSYSGYRLGTRPLAEVPCRVSVVEGAGNITSELQQAIDAVGRAGGGVVRIPQGSFVIDRTITIPHHNVAVEGAGSGRTNIHVPESYVPREASNEGVFTFGKVVGAWNQGWTHQGRVIGRITHRIRRGDFHVDSDDAGGVNPGDWVVVQQYFWDAFVDRHSTAPNRWVADGSNRTFSFTYLRQVLARSGRRLYFDAPIPWDLDPANNPIQLRYTDNRMVENVGIRGLTIEFANNRNSATQRPLGTGVFFEGVRNGWTADVVVRNMPRFGFYSLQSARLTFLDSHVRGAQDYGDDGYGYGFHIHSSQNILLKSSSVDDARRPFTSQRALTSVLVYSGCSSSNATQGDDTHHSFIHGVLWDRHRQSNGNNLTSYNRGNFSTGAYETLGYGVVWNFEGDGIRGRVSTGGQVHIKPSPDGEAIVAGGPGAHQVYDDSVGNPFRAGERILARPGFQTGTRPSALRNVLYEGVGQAGLKPDSLHEALLHERTGLAAATLAEVCRGSVFGINAGGVVNAASSGAYAPLAPGSLVSVYGALPVSASGTEVRVGAHRATVLHAGGSQWNIHIPFSAPVGSPVLRFTAPNHETASASIVLAEAAPGIFMGTDGHAVAQHPDSGALVSASRPARPGQAIVVYLTGAGPLDGTPPDGGPARFSPLFRAALPATASIGGLPARILFLGLTPGYLGLYQANLIVPEGLPAGEHALQLTVGGVASNAPPLRVAP